MIKFFNQRIDVNYICMTRQMMIKHIHQLQKRSFEDLGIQDPEQSGEGIVTGNTMLQLEEGVQKVPMDLTEIFHIHTCSMPTNHCDDGQSERFGKVVLGRIAPTGVLQFLKNLNNPRSHGVSS
ncbi:MAG: hypothetical protein TE42_02330 [Candidatus Synechococcus spongiarum SP3]|uniref:Uncharacterized protein n=1 Tax=Candidatus Synechococcus spongiarum SP3 TaxID=1604020 RepID=A0A0G2IWT9_9SYNE|nr:MAG: hypothetical protein TE42_02330 [Candidatus Synechococcus spongiarum SP3]